MRGLALVLLLLFTGAVAAMETSLRPQERPGTAVAPTASVVVGLATSLRPQKRPRSVERAGRKAARLLQQGAVCGDMGIQGDVLGRVASSVNGCGIAQAVGVRSVAGITLSPRATMDCPTAQALKAWVENSVKPTFSRYGGGVQSLRVAAHYACRPRNNRPGARISEHGKGRAIDISAFRMRDGTSVTVSEGWSARDTRQMMRAVHKGACGPFGTVLGPQADRYHKDHFHFDTARYRGGPYCR